MGAVPLALTVFAFLALAVAVYLGRPGPETERPGHDDEDQDEGGGGGGPRRDRPVPPTGPHGDADPPWWPEFERDLAAYCAQRGREREPAELA